MKKEKVIICPNCKQKQDANILHCQACQYPKVNNEDKWKPANMGKQRGKPEANRTGKK